MSQAEKAAPADPLRGLVFPPMPEALRITREESIKADPDLDRITKAIAGDVSLSAEVLKVVNSPAFGLKRPISSIPNGIMLLGLRNVINVVSAVALRVSMSGLGGMKLNRFWDSATDVAMAAAKVAKEYTAFPADMAYTAGLFHDCGIPLLMARFPEYGERVRLALAEGHNILVAEQQVTGMHHAGVGYHVARAWNLPEDICLAIHNHHNLAEITHPSGAVSEEVLTLVCVLKIAEQASASFRALAFKRIEDRAEWDAIRDALADRLAVSGDDLEGLLESLVEGLGKH